MKKTNPKMYHTRTPEGLQIPYQREQSNTCKSADNQMYIQIWNKKDPEEWPDFSEQDILRLKACWDACERANVSNEWLEADGIIRLMKELQRYEFDGADKTSEVLEEHYRDEEGVS